MGTDCSLTLPHRARVRDVADVMGMLLGCRGELTSLGRNAILLEVEGVSVCKTGDDILVECCYINVKTASRSWQELYHFEWSSNGGGRGILMRSRAENIALLVGIAKIFGGIVNYTDDGDRDFEAPENPLISATDGQEWDDWQRAMHAVKPLTKADIAAMKAHAAY